ncbi:hypothetical protein WA026_016603 [Henosepilachna vigintioctopunctata]|uniref:Uncharacterized protein n=1 Tax=Henosepilachna vigintioctopunctata TaxID=420089 RepID=A0AAW1VE06_9CUCU
MVNVIGLRGKKVGSITAAERGSLVKVVSVMSTSGIFFSALLLFPPKNMTQTLMKGAPLGSIGRCLEDVYGKSDSIGPLDRGRNKTVFTQFQPDVDSISDLTQTSELLGSAYLKCQTGAILYRYIHTVPILLFKCLFRHQRMKYLTEAVSHLRYCIDMVFLQTAESIKSIVHTGRSRGRARVRSGGQNIAKSSRTPRKSHNSTSSDSEFFVSLQSENYTAHTSPQTKMTLVAFFALKITSKIHMVKLGCSANHVGCGHTSNAQDATRGIIFLIFVSKFIPYL